MSAPDFSTFSRAFESSVNGMHSNALPSRPAPIAPISVGSVGSAPKVQTTDAKAPSSTKGNAKTMRYGWLAIGAVLAILAIFYVLKRKKNKKNKDKNNQSQPRRDIPRIAPIHRPPAPPNTPDVPRDDRYNSQGSLRGREIPVNPRGVENHPISSAPIHRRPELPVSYPPPPGPQPQQPSAPPATTKSDPMFTPLS